MTTTIAVLTDIHFGASPLPQRRSKIADLLLMRAVRRLNELIHPDVTLILGDVLDDGNAPDAGERLQRMRAILDKLHSPYIAIPGNHDGDPEAFYQVFDRSDDIVDIAGVRFLAFVDREMMPGYNAERSQRDLDRIRAARKDYDGPMVSLQHVCLFPPEKSLAPYNYTNANEVINAMKSAGVTLSISGHHHAGAEDTRDGGVTFVNAPGLCEKPFPFVVITMDGDDIQTQRHELAMPEHLHLIDNHLHTQLAYCSENMDVQRAIALSKDFGLAGLTFTEHSGQLYFDDKQYWGKLGLREGMHAAFAANNRMEHYLALKQAHTHDGVRFGLEVDCDYKGRLLINPEDRKRFDFVIGSMHALPSLNKDKPASEAKLKDEFLYLLERLLTHRIDVLAHPFRVFRRAGRVVPTALFEPTARLLRQHQVAAEINFHINEPPPDFIRICLERGVRFSFGSDAHNLYEIGDFAYHIALLREAGFDGDIADVLIQ